jgi:general secretion pathway protein G
MAVLNKNNQNQDGFTLIEILIVVILLGILATVIIPQVNVSIDDAKLNTLKTNLKRMRSAIIKKMMGD